METSSNLKVKLWNRNFFLLWQGQLVSVLGDVIYLMALNFWILEMTESTALMGLLSAMSMTPRIILGPFAGVFVDRWDRKKVIVFTDLIRGIFVTVIGIAAIGGFIQVWMVFVVGIVLGTCSAFFNPAIASTTPDIVHESKLIKANSVTSLGRNGMDMIGSAIGGILYVAIGAPYMFLFNGVSYLFSAFTESFMKVPKIKRKDEEVTFIEDFKVGLKFLNDFRVLKNMFIGASLLNLFANSAMILMIPYFNEMSFLGVSRYGFTMTVLALGAVAGSIFLSVINFKNNQKFRMFSITTFMQSALFVMFMLTDNYFLMLIFIFMGLFCNVCLNTIFSSSMMAVIPSQIRGKVMGIVSTISMGLTPLGQLMGGVLGEIFPIRIVMICLFLCCFLCGIYIIRVRNLRKLLEYDSSVDSVEELMNY